VLGYPGGGKIFAIFDIMARYISVTVQDSAIIAANDCTRNQVAFEKEALLCC